ncbi:hypothetical protein TEQG_06470 [Trichophyton equinum CBS 127.97]|uniref:Uncharacterized protein n=1 Tax=Trichophyton equinum (strain ATCC MYA-4606 / CBS 127.97) TaxID=559882 RepID=F2Q0D1_TRIEC|nr:hypothetical protein TEQG_06470 [Trichophyton equinum CBS 127.97]
MTIKAGTDARERLEIQFWRPLEEQLTQIIAVLQCIGCSSARNPEHPEATTIYNLWLRSMASMCGRDGRTGRDRQEASQPASQPCSSCTPMRISLRNTYPGRSYRPALLVSFLPVVACGEEGVGGCKREPSRAS